MVPLLPLFSTWGNWGLERLSRLSKAEPSLTIYASLSDSKAQVLISIAFCQDLQWFQLPWPEPLRPMVGHPQMGQWAKLTHFPSPFHVSLLTGAGSEGCGPEGEGTVYTPHPRHLWLSKLGPGAPPPGVPATDRPPAHGGKSRARVYTPLARKAYPNVRVEPLWYLFWVLAVLSAPQRAKVHSPWQPADASALHF